MKAGWLNERRLAMIVRANFNEAVRSLYAAKQRTLLALVGIVIGIGSVIAMVSVGTAVQDESLRQFKEMGTDVLTVEKDYGSAEGGGAPGEGSTFSLANALAMAIHCKSVAVVAPYAQVSGGDASYSGKAFERAGLIGVTASFPGVNKLRVESGRFLSDLDALSQFVVVGNDIAQELIRRGASQVIGEKLRFGDGMFTVIGVLANQAQGGVRRFDPNTSVFVHVSTALRLSADAELSLVNVRVRPGVDNNTARDEIAAFYAARSRGKAATVRISSPEDIIAQMEKQSQLFTLLLGAIGSISLVVGGVGVMNVMLVSVSERRREIGIRRALGARRGDIKGQFLIESLILSMLGGIVGITAGIAISMLICHFAQWQFQVSIMPILLGFCVSSVVGVFFGYYPARQASQLDPIVALRAD